MKPLFVALAAVCLVYCDRTASSSSPPPSGVPKKSVAQTTSPAAPDVIQVSFPQPVPGRARLIRSTELVATPEKYDGQRVILEGTYTGGFETSAFELSSVPSHFPIWVEIDWTKIDEPFGDFADRKRKWGRATPSQRGHVQYHIVAEGSFYFRKDPRALGLGGPPGFGHFGVSSACFLIDRLFVLEPLVPSVASQP